MPMRSVQTIRHVDTTDHGGDHLQGDAPELVSTLVKGLDILAVMAGGETLGNQQIAQRVGLSKATASRLCATLATLGYLRQDVNTRKFAMGSRLLAMGATVQHRAGYFSRAQPHMEELAEQTGMVVGMGARERTAMVCLDVARPTQGRQVGTTGVGSILPMAETAMGLAYLSHCGVAERIALLRQLQLAYGSDWPQVRERIEVAQAEYKRQGYVIRPRSCESGVSGVASAIEVPGHVGLLVFNCATHTDAPQVTARLHRAGVALCGMVQALAGRFRACSETV